MFRDFCDTVCDEPVPQLKFYEEVSRESCVVLMNIYGN